MSIQKEKKIFKYVSEKDRFGRVVGSLVSEKPEYKDDMKLFRKKFNIFSKNVCPDDLYIHNMGEFWQKGTSRGRVYKTSFENQFRHREYHIDGFSFSLHVNAENISIIIRTTSKLKTYSKRVIEQYILRKYSIKEYDKFDKVYTKGTVIYNYIGEDEYRDTANFKLVLDEICNSYLEILNSVLENEELQVSMKEELDNKSKIQFDKYLRYLSESIQGHKGMLYNNKEKKAPVIQEKKEDENDFVLEEDIVFEKEKKKKKKKKKYVKEDVICENKIFYGVSGSGKTYKLQELQNQYDGFVMVSFYQNYRYEDFIEGVKTKIDANGNTYKEVQNGIFKEICYEASMNPDNNYAIFINEIERGDIANIFGEVLSILDISKRKGAKDEMAIKLAYSRENFSIPNNLSIIGTVSIEHKKTLLMDTTLRRTFLFAELVPEYGLLNDDLDGINLQKMLQMMNARIEYLCGEEYMIGHTYFMDCDSFTTLQTIIKKRIIPLLKKYFQGDLVKVHMIFNNNGFIKTKKVDTKRLFSNCKNRDKIEHKVLHTIDKLALCKLENYQKIYR
ncbi:conserved domain protein [hydrothermal vent metagenome]|uniref:Conserved domain protein n=1 Tax=hydrothermal vent metagenome TaxID=652676 RepID=A0A1W1D2M7_9ZZZZ